MLSILKSALNANTKEMGIVSNNIANVNSTAFKKSKTNFEHIYSRDRSSSPSKFSPIAIIHHSGTVSGQTTHGHYRADVENKETGEWYRTSDNEAPKKLLANGLTKRGYIFLYKKSGIDAM